MFQIQGWIGLRGARCIAEKSVSLLGVCRAARAWGRRCGSAANTGGSSGRAPQPWGSEPPSAPWPFPPGSPREALQPLLPLSIRGFAASGQACVGPGEKGRPGETWNVPDLKKPRCRMSTQKGAQGGAGTSTLVKPSLPPPPQSGWGRICRASWAFLPGTAGIPPRALWPVPWSSAVLARPEDVSARSPPFLHGPTPRGVWVMKFVPFFFFVTDTVVFLLLQFPSGKQKVSCL